MPHLLSLSLLSFGLYFSCGFKFLLIFQVELKMNASIYTPYLGMRTGVVDDEKELHAMLETWMDPN